MTNKRLKIAVLYDTWEETAPEPEPEQKKPARGKTKRRRKPMEDREEIFAALEKLGHQPSYQVVDGHTSSLIALAKCDCDMFFNLTESYGGNDTMDMNMAAYLDLLGKPYTGAGPHALYLAQDKSIAKKLFAFHSIGTPFFASSYRGRLDHSHDIKFPLIVKPSSEDGSIGIDAGSVVESVKELMERIHYIHEEFDSPALIEEYIEGREIYAALLGSYERTKALPLIELDLSKLPEGARVACQDVKFERDTELYKLTKSAPVEDLPEDVEQLLKETALAAYQALKLRDYGRIDMRLTKKGKVYVIEANPNPWLSSGAEFAMACRKEGKTYTEMIGEIVDLAWSRYHP